MLLHTSLIELLIRLPVVLLALTIHEFMHGYAAYRCGDDTAYRMGRLTLNPLAHLDPLGTLALMLAPIGWAKPVPVNPSNFSYRTRRRDEVLVSGAGIAANFALGAGLALTARGLTYAGVLPESDFGRILWNTMGTGILVNFGLGLFNLLPIAPLDGSHILRNLLPAGVAVHLAQAQRYGPFLILGVVILNGRTGLLAYPIVHLTLLLAGEDATLQLYRPLVA